MCHKCFLILTFWRECTFAENPEGGRGQVAFQRALNLISHQIKCEKKIMSRFFGIFNSKEIILTSHLIHQDQMCVCLPWSWV